MTESLGEFVLKFFCFNFESDAKLNGFVEYLNDEYELNCACFDWIW